MANFRKIQETELDFDGRHWVLRCNMNVLCDVQDMFDGNLLAALSARKSLKSARAFLTAMLNDAAEREGLSIRYTPQQVGGLLPGNSKATKWIRTQISEMVFRAIVGYDPDEPEEETADTHG